MENSCNFILSFEFFKDATENKNGRQRLNFFVGAKTLKPKQIYAATALKS